MTTQPMATDAAVTPATRAWRLAAIVTTLMAVAFISVIPQVANDFWLQAKVGEIIFRERAIPSTLLFPYTEIQAARFNAHEWLPSLFYFWLISTVGESGLPLALGFGGLMLFGATAWLAYRRGNQSLPLALLCGLVAVGVENFRHTLRPELIALLLLAIYWHFLQSMRRQPTVLVWLGALATVVVWSNTHGSFVLAPLIAGIHAVGVWIDGRRVATHPDFTSSTSSRRFALFCVATLACTLVNPFGWELLSFSVRFSSSGFINDNVVEWHSIFDSRIRGQRGLWIGVACALAATGTALYHFRRLSAVDALMLLLFLLLTLRAVRFLIYLGMVFAYVIPPLVTPYLSQRATQIRHYAFCAALSAAVLGLALAFGNAMGGYPHQVGWDRSFSRAMLAALSNPNVQGNVLNDYEYGAELVYRAYPRLRPSIDSRIDSYGPDYFFYHQRLVHEEALFTEFVQRYDVRYLLMSHHNFQDFQKLPSYTGKRWLIQTVDRKAVFLRRSDLAP